MNNKKIKTEKVKAILKKCLDVFCYVVTALSITLAIAIGVNSCSGSNEPKRIDPQQELTALRNSLNPTDDELIVYESLYNGIAQKDFDSLRSTYDVPTTTSAVARATIARGFWFSELGFSGYWLNNSGDFLQLRRFVFYYQDMQINETGQYEYKLQRVIVEGYDNTWNTILVKSSTNSMEDVYDWTACRLVVTGDYITYEGFTAIYKVAEHTTFTFNASFNYNAPFGLPYNAVYGSSLSWSGGGDTMKYMTYDIGWFWSNGRLFNQIQWWAIKGDGVAVVIDSQIATLPEGDNWVYTFMYYKNSLSGESVLVNSRDSIPYNSGNSRYYANSSTWQVPAYRNIVLLNTPDNATIDLLGSFNNNNAYDSGLSVGGDMGDVFTLVGGAFAGLLPILTLQILPSVTIGTLLFVPLVAMLVFAIIRIIKK